MSEQRKKLTPKAYFNKVLNGAALGVIVGLIPNAVLAALLGLLGENSLAVTVIDLGKMFQIATPLIIGCLIAIQFKLEPMEIVIVGGATFVGSGVLQVGEEAGEYIGRGAGDIINAMLTAAVAVGLILIIGDKLGTVKIVASPILIGIGASLIGYMTLPYVMSLTQAIGNGINSFTTLQPYLMSLLIACSFAFLIVSPISTVAIGLAIGLSGVAAGAAAMGVAATTIVLVVNSWKVNKSGVTLAIALGAMKMMMPNLFRNPIMLVPIWITAIISSVPVAYFSISGTPQSAGFGLVGLVGPLASIDAGLSLLLAGLAWLLIPILAGLASQALCEKIFKLYDRKEVFEFRANS